MRAWLMRHVASGQLHVVGERAGYSAPAWVTVRAVAAGEDTSFVKWVNGQAVFDVAALEAQLIAGVKADAERRKMMRASPGGYKKAEYAAKAAEVLAWDSLGGTAAAILAAFTGLSPAVRLRKFRYAIASAAARGDQVSDAIARFRGGLDLSDAEAARLAAVEEKAVAAIRSAATATAKRSVAAAVNWG